MCGAHQDKVDHLKLQDDPEKILKERIAELNAQNAELLEEMQKHKQAEIRIRALYCQLLENQELKRQKISHDLNDNVAQDLFRLKLDIDTLISDEQTASVATRSTVVRLSEIVQHAITSIREITHEISPHRLILLGLLPTLSRYCKEFSKQYAVTVDFFPAGIENFDIDFSIEIALYRIIQDYLNIVIKYTNASVVTIKLVMSFPNIILRIHDNGKGTDKQNVLATAANAKSLEIQGLAERAGMLDGTLRIESRSGQGTEIMLEIPWKKRNN